MSKRPIKVLKKASVTRDEFGDKLFEALMSPVQAPSRVRESVRVCESKLPMSNFVTSKDDAVALLFGGAE